jgi:hypothetical protein
MTFCEYLEVAIYRTAGVWKWRKSDQPLQDTGGLTQRMNELHREGWELMSTYPSPGTTGQRESIHYLFKRPIGMSEIRGSDATEKPN